MEVTPRRLTAILAGLPLAAAIGCGSESPVADSFFSEACKLEDTVVESSASSVHFELAAALGTVEDAGYLADRGTLGDIVRDHSGNYWVGQREEIKVFAPTGTFVATVGRAGQGPMEFAFAQPMHTDALGRVHVFDNRQARVSVIQPDMTLHEVKSLPATAVFAMTPLADGDRYAVQAWIPDSEGSGRPIHVITGDGAISTSLGPVIRSEPSIRDSGWFTAQRRLTTDPAGNIFSSHYYDYLIEAWSEEGVRIGKLEGPVLNDGPRIPGPWTWENPPWNEIHDIMVDSQGRLWIILHYRRPDWRDGMVEVGPPGRTMLNSKDGTLSSYLHSRIDVIDLQRCTTVASQWHDGVQLNFVEEGMVSEIAYGDVGQEFVKIWRLTHDF